jgi:hypothetical protein
MFRPESIEQVPTKIEAENIESDSKKNNYREYRINYWDGLSAFKI